MLERSKIMRTSIRSSRGARVIRGTSVRTLLDKLREDVKERVNPR